MARIRREWLNDPGRVPDGFQPGLPRLVRQVLWSRQDAVPDVDSFLHAEDNALVDPRRMTGMAAAVDLVASAVRDGRRVAIFGDYDADGVTATALLVRGLRAVGADAITYIPHRVLDGYGLSGGGLEELHRAGAEVVISCDCGTNSVEVVANRPAGQQLVITDHHLPAIEIARPDALLNPHQPGDEYPFKDLSGAGVAFKLVQALVEGPLSDRAGAAELEELMQLVALGAVADVVPLTGENRTLVRRGLAALRKSPLPGIAAMIKVGGLKGSVSSGTIGFQLAPRINAAGRMDDARLALDLLLAPSVEAAMPLAEALEQHNVNRRQATEEAVRQAAERLDELGEVGAAIVLADERWPMGLVGLISGRLTEEHAVPSFILNLDGGEARGSARSVTGFNVVEALDSCAPLLHRYGGHAMAAGLSLSVENLPALAEQLEAVAAAARPEGGWPRAMRLDGEVRLGELTPAEVNALEVLEPHGEGNPAPRFCGRGLEIKSVNAFGVGGAHLKLWLEQDERIVEAVAWGKGRYFQQYQRAWRDGKRLDVLYFPSTSDWDDAVSVQLELHDVKVSAPVVATA